MQRNLINISFSAQAGHHYTKREIDMTGLPAGYDAWRLSTPEDDRVDIGIEVGDPCNRYPEPDEDMPRNYRPRRCRGVMYLDSTYGDIACDACGEIA